MGAYRVLVLEVCIVKPSYKIISKLDVTLLFCGGSGFTGREKDMLNPMGWSEKVLACPKEESKGIYLYADGETEAENVCTSFPESQRNKLLRYCSF